MAESQPTIYDVAERAGVSIATVSRAINSLDSVRPSTRERVMKAMEELHFVPNAVARGLSKGKHWILGLVFVHAPMADDVLDVEELSLLYTDIVIRGAESRAAANGYSLLLLGAGENHPAGMAPLLNLTGTVDGLILLDQVLPEAEAEYLARRLPVVLLAGSGRAHGVTTVRVDNEMSMFALADHFVDVHGVSRAGFVAGLDASPDSVSREAAFKSRMAQRGVDVADRDILRADWTSAGGEQAMQARLDLGAPLPEVFACANDQMAVGVIYTLRANGLRVPEDLLISGFDDITITRYLDPSLTTIRQSGALLGEAAVDAIVSQLAGTTPAEREIVMPTKLVVRRSCGCTASSEESSIAMDQADVVREVSR